MDSRNHGKNQNACHEIDTTCRAAPVAPHKHTGVAGVEKPVPVNSDAAIARSPLIVNTTVIAVSTAVSVLSITPPGRSLSEGGCRLPAL